MSDHRERACTRCGSLLHHEDDCRVAASPSAGERPPVPFAEWERVARLADEHRVARRQSESRLAEMETEIADRADAEQHLMRDVADLSDRLAEITREREGVVDGLDEFSPHNTGLSLPESVALLRTRLCEVRAEIEGKGGWRERLAETARALDESRINHIDANTRNMRACDRLAEITRAVEGLAKEWERRAMVRERDKLGPREAGRAEAERWCMGDLRALLSSGAGEGRQ